MMRRQLAAAEALTPCSVSMGVPSMARLKA